MPAAGPTLPPLPCACANLRRAARAVTKLYNRELSEAGLEATQFALLMALSATGETTQGNLGHLLSLDTTSLTRMLAMPAQRGWIVATPGKDRRRRLLRLTPAGKHKLEDSRPAWERAQRKLHRSLGDSAWTHLKPLLTDLARAAETK